MNKILNYLDKLYENPKCELNYTKDYELLMAIVLSAQTTDKRVNSITKILFKKYDSLEKLANAPIKDIEEIIKPIGTYHKKAIFIHNIATELNSIGSVPYDRSQLEKLSGVGRKTINVFLSELNKEDTIGVDTHVSRVSKRLNIAEKNDNVLTIEKKLMKKFPKNTWRKLHLQLVLFGRYKCKALNPICDNCKLKDICNYERRQKNDNNRWKKRK